ncbi:MAG: glycosyltransferase family 4 protein [Nitrososphaerota archaeon]|nr:glycosyltransferase family 4 protein [Nitrososphaerota archaeon]
MSRILILSELWYPEGGGAEVASQLYASKLIELGHHVTVATTSRVAKNLGPSCEIQHLDISSTQKSSLLISSRKIKEKIKELAVQSDVVYIPGKLIFLAPFLRREKVAAKIVVHLHDYQLICPHASMYNFISHKTCENVWSDLTCARCSRIYESKEHDRTFTSWTGAVVTLAWRNLMKISQLADLIDSIDCFITVSKAQADLIASSIGEFSSRFRNKNKTIYNPVNMSIKYVLPQFNKNHEICAGFLGGDRYMKGFDIAESKINDVSFANVKLLVTKSKGRLYENKIEFLGWLSGDEMAELFKRIWVVLFTSRWNEPLPYAVVESQLRGRPVIGTAVGGVEECIAKIGFTGDVVKNGESFEPYIRKYADRIGNDPRLTQEISRASESFFAERSAHAYSNFQDVLF